MSKPTNKPGWNPTDPSKLEEPSSLKKQQGWAEGEKPSSKHFNWLMKATSEWVDYVDSDVASKQYVDSAIDGRATTQEVSSEVQGAKDYADAAVASGMQEAKDHADTAVSSGVQEAKSYADSAVANLVNAAPAALDTLNELAAALGNDANFSASVTSVISSKANSSEVENALALKANASDVSASLALKADASEVNAALASKASSSDLLAEVSRAQASEADKASISLNNLASTAVNADIFPDTTGTRNLGSQALRFSTINANKLDGSYGGVGYSTVGSTGGAGFGLYGTTTAADLFIKTFGQSSSNTKSVYIESGNASGTTSNSGDILLTTGTATGTRGKIALSASQIDLGASIIPTASAAFSLGSFSSRFTTVAANSFTAAYGYMEHYTMPSGATAHVIRNGTSAPYNTGVITTNRSSASTDSSAVHLETGNATGTTSNSGDIKLTTGTATGTRGKISLNANTVDVNSTRIINVATPSSGNDAVNKTYCDSAAQFGINSFIELPGAKEYTLIESAPRAMTIDTIKIKTNSGTCRANVRIGGTSVTGMSAISVSENQTTATATASNTVAAGARVTIVIDNISAAIDLALTIKVI